MTNPLFIQIFQCLMFPFQKHQLSCYTFSMQYSLMKLIGRSHSPQSLLVELLVQASLNTTRRGDSNIRTHVCYLRFCFVFNQDFEKTKNLIDYEVQQIPLKMSARSLKFIGTMLPVLAVPLSKEDVLLYLLLNFPYLLISYKS